MMVAVDWWNSLLARTLHISGSRGLLETLLGSPSLLAPDFLVPRGSQAGLVTGDDSIRGQHFITQNINTVVKISLKDYVKDDSFYQGFQKVNLVAFGTMSWG